MVHKQPQIFETAAQSTHSQQQPARLLLAAGRHRIWMEAAISLLVLLEFGVRSTFYYPYIHFHIYIATALNKLTS